jgi:hypothetical protein
MMDDSPLLFNNTISIAKISVEPNENIMYEYNKLDRVRK